jgi:hypothetical protein
MSENANNDPIGKALGLNPIQNTSNVYNKLVADSHDDSAKTDFEYARANLYDVISEGKEALLNLGQIAKASQHPRSYEVYAKMIDSLVAANEKLLDLQKEIRVISNSDAPLNEKAQTINNNLFVGSTNELQKMIEQIKNGQS